MLNGSLSTSRTAKFHKLRIFNDEMHSCAAAHASYVVTGSTHDEGDNSTSPCTKTQGTVISHEDSGRCHLALVLPHGEKKFTGTGKAIFTREPALYDRSQLLGNTSEDDHLKKELYPLHRWRCYTGGSGKYMSLGHIVTTHGSLHQHDDLTNDSRRCSYYDRSYRKWQMMMSLCFVPHQRLLFNKDDHGKKPKLEKTCPPHNSRGYLRGIQWLTRK
jgi:hypothetical protein